LQVLRYGLVGAVELVLHLLNLTIVALVRKVPVQRCMHDRPSGSLEISTIWLTRVPYTIKYRVASVLGVHASTKNVKGIKRG